LNGDPILSNDTTPTAEPNQTHAPSGPYAASVAEYRRRGWLGVLPVVGKDVNLPAGYTGYDGRWPSADQVDRWREERGHDNVALRVPADVLGLDVDAYDGRAGLTTLGHAEEEYGALPATWTSTSRDDGSGIRWYRVPPEPEWVSDLGRGSGIEVIRTHHRYAVVWPSVHPLTGREYRWYGPDGLVASRVPSPTELVQLPPRWVAALRRDSADARMRRSLGGHRDDRVHVVDMDGNPVDPRLVLVEGLPPGSQQVELFRWACSMRERRVHIDEAKALGMLALQRLVNENPAEPWTAQHIHDIVDRVWDRYPPGTPLTLPVEVRQLAERLARQSRDGVARTRVAEEPPREANASDLGNTLRFVALHRDSVRYAADVDRWYVWDGRRWEPDRTNRVMDLTKNVVDAIRAEAVSGDGGREEVDRWLAWARSTEAIGRRRAMLEGAESEPALVTTSDAFDRDPSLLVVRNGTVNLVTGELQECRPDDMCTHIAEVDFDPSATSERWHDHVSFMCNGDPALVAYVQRAVGYTLTGETGERNFFFLEGDGSNGKNAFIEPLMMVMGSYAQAASTALLTGGDEQHATILADLQGSRLVFVDETRVDKALNVERIKALTGSKNVRARFMRKDFFEYQARFKLWIAGNGQPKLNDRSDGVWNRLHLVRCLGKVDEQRKIKNYGDLLYAEESSGILRWALEGLRAYRVIGALGVPTSVRDDVDEYRDEEDYEKQFVDECLLVTGDERHVVANDAIFQCYRRWAENVGLRREEIRNRTHLGRSLARLQVGQRDVIKVSRRAVRVLRGVTWNQGVNLVGIDDPLRG
jgi:P4 family phage/plasmid primase-like protien